jgi:catechol 2,3-dioxygenase-like lactoylglutathione lyase family enzyme
MSSKINHVAIVSEKYPLLSKFYEALFGMTGSPKVKPHSALTVGDGYVGLNINPRKPGRPGGLDHFGIEVDNADEVFEKLQRQYPTAHWIKRPGNRPFAGITANDPDGNVFDLSQRNMENRSHVYADSPGEQNARFISHVAMRTMRPDEMARFYCDVFGLVEQNAASDDVNHYLSDGRVTLVVMPYDIRNYSGQSILPPGMDHVGFTVENLDRFKSDLDDLVGGNPVMTTPTVGHGKEGLERLALLKRQCPWAKMFISDPDYTMVAIKAAN